MLEFISWTLPRDCLTRSDQSVNQESMCIVSRTIILTFSLAYVASGFSLLLFIFASVLYLLSSRASNWVSGDVTIFQRECGINSGQKKRIVGVQVGNNKPRQKLGDSLSKSHESLAHIAT